MKYKIYKMFYYVVVGSENPLAMKLPDSYEIEIQDFPRPTETYTFGLIKKIILN